MSSQEKAMDVLGRERPVFAKPEAGEAEVVDTGTDVAQTEAQTAADTPYDWPQSRKIAIALTVSLAQLVGVSSGSFMAAALPIINRATHMSNIEGQIAFCIYMLGLGLGPTLLGPASEVFGRKPVWLFGTMFYAVCNAICPVGESKVVLILFRFLSGIGGASGVALTGPILADMFRKEQRGKAIAIGTLLPYLGPAIGPILGGLLTQYVAWPWLFWMMSLVEAAAIVLGYFVIRETYGPVIRWKREQKLKKKNAQQTKDSAPTATEELEVALLTKVRRRLLLPARMLFTRPIALILAILEAVDFAIYVLVLSIYATLFSKKYHETPTISSLHYIAIALGAWLASQIGGRVMDWTYARMKARSGLETGEPEFRIPLFAAGSIIEAVGMLWLGWSAYAGITWVMVDIGAFIFTTGSFVAASAILAYMLDEFADDSASANAAIRLVSYLLAFSLPLPAPAMYERLGYGWGNTLLALIWIALAVPSIFVLYFRGAQVRAIGRKAEAGRDGST